MGDLVGTTALGANPYIHPLPNPHRSYCSLGYKHFASIRTIKQAEKLIKDIFQRTPLCWHAVDLINQIYHQVLHIEQRTDVETDTNSVHIFQFIIEKVYGITATVFQGRNMSSSELKGLSHNVISYHFLQRFLAPELRLQGLSQRLSLSSPSVSKRDLRHMIAAEIPSCGSVEQFEQDLNDLLGEEWDDFIECHVEKKEQIATPKQKILTKTLDIADCKQELSILRQQGLSYPAYYDELVERGFTNLYRYLNEMRTLDSYESRKAKILTMSFAQVFQVMHETYEALMQSVEKSIGPDPTEVIFLVGDTGVGKTTAFCAICGKNLKLRKDDLYDLVDEPDNMIGHGSSSCTFLPSVHLIDGKAIVDFPGLRDTNGWPISLMIELVLFILGNKYQSKILVLESITNDSGRYQGVSELANRLERIFGTKEKLFLGITKYSQDKDFEKKQGEKRARENNYSIYREQIDKEEKSIQNLQEKIPKIEKKIQEVQKKSSSNAESSQKETNKLELKLQHAQEKLEKKKASLEKYTEQLELYSRESEKELECQVIIDKKEEKLRSAIGITKDNRFIRFFNLESQETIEAIRTQLFQCQTPNHSSLSVLELDPSMRQSIMDHFQQQLIPSLEFQKRRFKNINSFGASVLNIGLTATISSPVVWVVLNLPGMAPTLLDQLDKELLDVCINGFMKMIFSDPIVNYIRQLVVKLREQNAITVKQTTKQLMDRWQAFETYITTILLRESPPENIAAADQLWTSLTSRYAIEPTEEIHLPAFLKLFLPFGTCSWLEIKINNRVEAQSWEQNLQAYERAMTDIEHNLSGLQQLKSFLTKRDEIHQIVKNTSLSFDKRNQFFKSVERLIVEVRQESGVDDWDKRMDFLTPAFINSPLHSLLNSQNTYGLFATLLKTFVELEGLRSTSLSSSFKKLIFDTWKISFDSLTPLTSLQLIDCVMKSGVHNNVYSIEQERKMREEYDNRPAPDPTAWELWD